MGTLQRLQMVADRTRRQGHRHDGGAMHRGGDFSDQPPRHRQRRVQPVHRRRTGPRRRLRGGPADRGRDALAKSHSSRAAETATGLRGFAFERMIAYAITVGSMMTVNCTGGMTTANMSEKTSVMNAPI